MRKLPRIIIALLLLVQSCTGPHRQFKTALESPDKFQDEEIEIVGIFHDRADDHAIYLTPTTSDKKDAIWINFSKLFMLFNTFDGGLDGRKIRVRGIFNSELKGDLGQYAGSLDNALIMKIERDTSYHD